MLPAIPQELSDMILDFLHDDVATLCSAGLVCKSWVPISRFHLFSEVHFYLWCGAPSREWELICAEYSTIPPYVLSLEISGGGSFDCHVDETILRFPLLSNLKAFRLFQVNLAILTPAVKERLTALLQSITILDLDCCEFETVNQAIDFIAAAPRLEDIALDSIHCSESSNYSSQAIPPPLKWIKFERVTPLDIIMDWIRRCLPTPSVHALEILRLCEDDDIPIVCKFIRHLGPALENLTISYNEGEDSEREVQNALSEGIDLSQNISLRNISFDCPSSRPCGWIIPIISTIAHSSLETVAIFVYSIYVNEIEALELSTFDTLFLNPPLSNNSTKLRFCIRCITGFRFDREGFLDALKDGLPKLDGKKRLELEYDILDYSM